MRNYLKQVLLCCLLWISLIPSAFAAGTVMLLTIDGAIGPATYDYIQRGLTQAENEKASAVIIQLNTPGGLESSTRLINAAILASPIPVIAYVAPAGARAASAGTFILYASHLAAMAPGSNIGAASPVSIAPTEDKTMAKKAKNDASAYIKSLAELRKRNVNFAERAVNNASSISTEEAKRTQVINIVADNYPQLLHEINGKTVVADGKPITLSTKGASIETVTPNWRFQFLSFITNPNIAYILMLVAIYGLFFEFSNPGMVLPGVVGVISLLLVLYAFQLMPVNYVGLTLLLLGIGFMVFEVFISSFGVLGIGGVLAFVVGSIMLFDTQNPEFKLALPIIIAMSLVSSVFFLAVLSLAIRAHKRAIVTGPEGLIGGEAVVLAVENGRISVGLRGEIWEASTHASVQAGDKVTITHVHGLKLTVVPRR